MIFFFINYLQNKNEFKLFSIDKMIKVINNDKNDPKSNIRIKR